MLVRTETTLTYAGAKVALDAALARAEQIGGRLQRRRDRHRRNAPGLRPDGRRLRRVRVDRPGQGVDGRRLRRHPDRHLLRRHRRRGRRPRGHRPARPGRGLRRWRSRARRRDVRRRRRRLRRVGRTGQGRRLRRCRRRRGDRGPTPPALTAHHEKRTHDDPVHAAGGRDRRHARGRPARRRGDRPDAGHADQPTDRHRHRCRPPGRHPLAGRTARQRGQRDPRPRRRPPRPRRRDASPRAGLQRDPPGRAARVSTTFEDGTAYGRLVGDGFESELPQELDGPDALPDLIVRLLVESGVTHHHVV